MDLLRLPAKPALAFGLRWQIIDKFESEHAQIKKIRASGYTRWADYKKGSDRVVGLVREASLDPNATISSAKKKNQQNNAIISGAACIAAHPDVKGKTLLILIEVPSEVGGTVIAVGLDRGVVVLDRLLPPGQVPSLVNGFASTVRNTDYQVWGDAYTINPVEQVFDMDMLFKAANKSARIRPISSGRPLRWVAVIGGLLALAGVGAMIWSQQTERQKEELRKRVIAQNSPQAQYQRSVAALLTQPVYRLADVLATVRQRLGPIPSVHAGWELSKATCNVQACTLRWQRINAIGASLEDFRAKAPADWTDIAVAGQDVITCSVAIKVVATQLEKSTWPNARAFTERLITHWQFLEPGGWRAEVGPVKAQAIPPNFEAAAEAAVASDPNAIWAMPITIKSQPLWYAEPDPRSPVAVDAIGANTVIDGDLEIAVSPRNVLFSVVGKSYVNP